MHDNTFTQSFKLSSKSQKTHLQLGSATNTTLSSFPNQSNNATFNQILSYLTDIKQDIKSLKHDIHNLNKNKLN